MDEIEKNVNNCFYIRGNDEYEVHGWLYWNKDLPLIYNEKKDNTEEVVFVFERLSHDLWDYIENNILKEYKGNYSGDTTWTYDFIKLKMFIIKWLLKRWTLPIELVKKSNGELTDESYKRVMNVHPAILKYFVNEFENTMFISDEDKQTITKQCGLLFHPKSKGVSNPHNAVSMYCSLTGFWEKFGLNYYDMQRLPHDVFIQLKMVLSNEISIRSKEMENIGRQNKTKRH